MEISKDEARMVMAALDKVPVQGLNAQKAVLHLCVKIEEFINSKEEHGDDVPTAAE